MPSINFDLLKHWFERLADLSESDRIAFLNEAREIDDDTRRQLLQLLSADAALVGHTARPALKNLSTKSEDPEAIGQRIGVYAIDRSLGHGGMGSVYLAHRADGSIEQQVAIKIVRPEVLDQHTIARFHLERQVLALLKHPHIATLLDAGELADGSPYVVMEYIEGEPITAYANTQQLDTRARLQLFLKVCEAVAFAHQNLIVHRDLKPSNVLVAADGQPKLLDFGIAKPLIGAVGAIDVQETAAAQRFFSPHNAAPEQLRNEPITPACDVYGLGVLLYELLTGSKPLDLQGLTPGEMEQRVLHEDPRPPSHKAAEAEAAHGKTFIPSRALKGDLDAIVLKCLRKRAADRYTRVDDLSADLHAHLDGFPVRARRGGRWYRLRRFVGRHRLAVAASIALIAVSAVGALTWFRQYMATIEQQSRADQMTSLIMDAIKAADPGGGNAKDMKVRELFDRISKDAIANAEREGRRSASLFASLSGVERRLGVPERALQLVESFDLATLSRSDQRLILRARADALLSLGRYESSQALIAAGLALAETVEEDINWRLTDTLIDFNLGRVTEAIAKIEALDLSAVSFKLRIEGRVQLARGYIDKGSHDKARAVLAAVLEEQTRQLPANDPGFLQTYNAFYALNFEESKLDEAADYARKAMALCELLYSRDSFRYANALSMQAVIASRSGKNDEALALQLQVLSAFQGAFGENHPDIAKAHFNLAELYRELGNAEQAMLHSRDAVAVAERVWLPTDSNLLLFRAVYAGLLLERSQFEQAGAMARKARLDALTNPELSDNPFVAATLVIEAIDAFHRTGTDPDRVSMLAAQQSMTAMEHGPMADQLMQLLASVIARMGVAVADADRNTSAIAR